MNRNSNWDDRQNKSYGGYDNRPYKDNYYRNPHKRRPVRYPDKRKKLNTKGVPLLITLVSILLALVIVYIILYINFFSYKHEIKDVLTASGSASAEIIEDIMIISICMLIPIRESFRFRILSLKARAIIKAINI